MYPAGMSRRIGSLVALLLAACAGHAAEPVVPADGEATGSESEPPPPTTPPPPPAELRLIHAAVESREQPVTLVIDASAATAATGYEFASAYLPTTPAEHPVSARASETELIGASFSFPEGRSTLIAYSTADFPVALALASDTAEPAPDGSAQIRVFHALVGQGAVDVCSPPATARGDGAPVVLDVAPGALGSDGRYTIVPAGTELAVQLRAHHATPCHGRAIGIAHGFTPVSAANYTLVFVGRTGRRGVSPELLFCADPPADDTSCATVAIDAH